jgi:hypothetical protein
MADKQASKLEPMRNLTLSLPFTPTLIITHSETNKMTNDIKKHCSKQSINKSQKQLLKTAPVISELFNNKLFDQKLSIWPINTHLSNTKSASFKLNILNYSLPFDNREIDKIKTLKSNPNFNFKSQNPKTQKLLKAYENSNCPNCSTPNPTRLHIFSECPTTIIKLNELNDNIDQLIQQSTNTNAIIPKWFNTNNTHSINFQPTFFSDFPKHKGDLGFIPKSLIKLIKLIPSNLNIKQKTELTLNIVKLINQQLLKTWTEHRNKRYESIPDELKGNKFKKAKQNWFKNKTKKHNRRTRYRMVIPKNKSNQKERIFKNHSTKSMKSK